MSKHTENFAKYIKFKKVNNDADNPSYKQKSTYYHKPFKALRRTLLSGVLS